MTCSRQANRSMKVCFSSFRSAAFLHRPFLFLMIGVCTLTAANAQTVSHPRSELSTTAKHYSYTHMLSATVKKEIGYVIVLASNGDVKTVFNACDVCYPSNKGYSQNGTELRCNNCGNRFPIDGLGNKNTGGTCNPGYLPHSIDGTNVVISVADLLAGAYFFPAQTVTEVENIANPSGITLVTNNRRQLLVTLPGEANRTFHVFSMNGQRCRTATNSSKSVQIDITDLAAGAYLLAVQEGKTLATKAFLVY